MKLGEILNPSARPTGPASEYLEQLAKELDVPRSRYDEARRRYESVGNWLGRDESTLKDMNPDVYVQGSFRFGTPIRPVNDDEHYDIDLVCELSVSKTEMTQQKVKELFGVEMKAYAKAHGMQDAGEGRRCWTLDYAAEAQFHLDALPAVPDGVRMRRLLVEAHVDASWAETAIAITDNEGFNYRSIDDDWPHSNPRGYLKWFRSRMNSSFRQIREAMALEASASVEEIPAYAVKTPLQQAVQILKYHRDMMFAGNSEHKPISVIITTLAGQSYQGERNVAEALAGILERMEGHIKWVQGVAFIANPTDPKENFADRWRLAPEKRECFKAWLGQARRDFDSIAKQSKPEQLVEAASSAFGAQKARAAAATRRKLTVLASLYEGASSLFSAPYKLATPWPEGKVGSVRINKATWSGYGHARPSRFSSDGLPLKKGSSLEFRAFTDIPPPYEVYWQVVNSGTEAQAAGNLRGGFDVGTINRGSIVHDESATYSGKHTIECFIVKDRHLAARSGAFVVNVA